MNKKISKTISIITLIVVFMFTSSESLKGFVYAANEEDVSYRTTCTVYGDLNKDGNIDMFDVIEMRVMAVDNKYSEIADLNHDNKVDKNDLVLLSDYVMGKSVFFDAYFYDDADEDNVCDIFEISLLKTNPDSADTDGDTLSDYDEIVCTKTSPTNKRTRGLSVTDAEDDYDEDNLTNSEEISVGTDPCSSDSDSDDISDYDEIKKYNTDPNNDDSDDDNIKDGDEIKLGLKPDSDKSDGNVLDNQRTFEQTISSENSLFSNINVDETPYTISVDIVSAGIAEKSLSIHTGEFTNESEDDRFKGKSISFSYTDNLKFDSAKIYFQPKEINKIEDYMIFEYFPDTNYLLPVESKYTADSVYTEASKLGTYCLVDISEEAAISNKSVGFSSDEIIYDYELGETEAAFFVDISGSLDGTVLEETKKSIHDFSQALFEHSENSYVTIIGYYGNPFSGDAKVLQYFDSNNYSILKTIDSVDEALNQLELYTINQNNDLNSAVYSLQRLINDGLYSSDCKNKYAFILADSTYTMTNSKGYQLFIPPRIQTMLKNISNNAIRLNYILSFENYSKSKAVNNLKEVCDPLGFGIYSKSEIGYFAVDSFARIYSDAIVDFKSIGVAYTSSLNPNKIPERVERNAFINSLSKSYDKTKVPEADSDGKIDFKDAAVKVGAANLDKNGNLIFRSLYDACDVSDAARLGYEQYMKNKKVSDMLISGAIQIVPFSDKILYEDNDGDGIPNKDDPYPDEPFDDRFMIVDDYNYEPTIDFVEKHYNYGLQCYNSRNDFIDNHTYKNVRSMFYLGRILTYTTLLQMLHFDSTENIDWTDTYEKFDRFLNHYLVKNGKLMEISSEDMWNIISTQKDNMEHYFYNVNAMKNCVEQVLKENNNPNTKIISSTSGNNFIVACYDGANCTHSQNYSTSDALDWGFAIGEALGGMTAEAYFENGTYHMNLKYYLIDTYEFPYHWTDDDHEDMITIMAHGLHETGYAKEYKIIGCYEKTFEWKKGETLFEGMYNEKLKIFTDSLNAEPLY